MFANKSVKIILAIVVAITGVFIILWALSSSQNRSSKTNTSTPKSVTIALQPKAIITLTAKGFQPNVVHVKVNERVEWVNESGKTATVNSNPHPLNNAYKPLNLGQFQNHSTLQIYFPKKGTYGYHNYFNPSMTGTIIVE